MCLLGFRTDDPIPMELNHKYSPSFLRRVHITTWSVSDGFSYSLTAGHMYSYRDDHRLFQVQVPFGYKAKRPGCGVVDASFSGNVLCLAPNPSTAASSD